jgi:GT2 family glycosyltransferase
MLDQIGIFDDRYFLFTEEVDLCHRAKRSGWKMAVCTQSSVYHKDSASTKDHQHLYYYLLCKSNLLFVLKFYSILYTLVAIPSLLLYATIHTRNPRNIIAAFNGMLAAFSNNHSNFSVDSVDLKNISVQ